MKEKLHNLPEKGSSYESITEKVDELLSKMTPETRGKLSSTSFWGVGDSQEIVKETFLKFFSWNALFTFQESSAAKMEDDVLDICIGLVGGDANARGNLTSGGTESNFSALHAMRNWARKKHPKIKTPQIVVPYSIHATVHKVAKILDIKVVTIPQKENLSADLEAMRNAIGGNTIGIVASAPNWPYACVDPIEELAAISLEKDLWLHVDACVGAYILPFFRELGEDVPRYDLSIEGVRSISGDLHKYGFAPKPCSTILWRSQNEQSYHYLPVMEWPCGLYISQGFVGSRPLAPIAAIWALMHYLGREGYIDNARKILKTRNTIVKKIETIEGLKTWPSHGPLLQIASDSFDIQLVVGAMEQRGWRLLGVIDPPAIHLTIDVMQPNDLQQFLTDLENSVEDIVSGKVDREGLLSYGGVGAEESAPKWLLSAVEIMHKKEQLKEDQ
jgi:glutamate/tyrosine decarboxylase-like PLP-dependent enzyme